MEEALDLSSDRILNNNKIAVLIVGLMELDPAIQFALIAHHTPNLVPCNDM